MLLTNHLPCNEVINYLIATCVANDERNACVTLPQFKRNGILNTSTICTRNNLLVNQLNYFLIRNFHESN